MENKDRYRIGFVGKGATCIWTNDNKDRIPIIDTKSSFIHGECIALAWDERSAKIITEALNKYDN